MFFGNYNKAVVKDSWFEELIRTAINNDVVVAYNQATIDMLLTSIAITDKQEVKDQPTYETNSAVQRS